eukprot:3196420-Rhodomonas_salina.1
MTTGTLTPPMLLCAHPHFAMLLCAVLNGMSGTETGYAAMRMVLTSGMMLRRCYGMSGTEIEYGGAGACGARITCASTKCGSCS